MTVSFQSHPLPQQKEYALRCYSSKKAYNFQFLLHKLEVYMVLHVIDFRFQKPMKPFQNIIENFTMAVDWKIRCFSCL